MSRVYSFGYKLHGEDQFATTGPAAPRIFDVRCLYNPHNNATLRRLTGRDKAVQDVVMNSTQAKEIVERAYDYLVADPRRSVAFGCSYGKHRSVALAEVLAERLPHTTVIHTGAASMGKNVT